MKNDKPEKQATIEDHNKYVRELQERYWQDRAWADEVLRKERARVLPRNDAFIKPRAVKIKAKVVPAGRGGYGR
jgi:hypothetical protein